LKFSKNKFQKLPERRQIKKIIDLCNVIDINWDNQEVINDLFDNLKNYFMWISENSIDNFHKFCSEFDYNLSQREFQQLYIPYEQTHFSAKKDREIVIQQKDKIRRSGDTIPVVVILDNLRSAFNVGAIFRTSECVGISEIALCGYTPLPDMKKVKDSAMGTEKMVKWKQFNSTFQAIQHYRANKHSIYALETVSSAESIFDSEFKESMALILGNEALGISEKNLRLCDKIIKIPVFGIKNSLNVGIAFSVSAYEIRRKMTS